MAFPITGSTATVTSVTAGTDVKFLFDVLKINEVAINTEADEFDISELSGSGAAVERLSGLRSGTMTFSGFYPKAAPKIGNTGLLTYNAQTVGFVQDWTMDIDFGEIDITSFNATAPTVTILFANSGERLTVKRRDAAAEASRLGCSGQILTHNQFSHHVIKICGHKTLNQLNARLRRLESVDTRSAACAGSVARTREKDSVALELILSSRANLLE